MKQPLRTAHGSVIKSKTKIGIDQNYKGRNQNDKDKHKNCHPLFQIHTPSAQEFRANYPVTS